MTQSMSVFLLTFLTKAHENHLHIRAGTQRRKLKMGLGPPNANEPQKTQNLFSPGEIHGVKATALTIQLFKPRNIVGIPSTTWTG